MGTKPRDPVPLQVAKEGPLPAALHDFVFTRSPVAAEAREILKDPDAYDGNVAWCMGDLVVAGGFNTEEQNIALLLVRGSLIVEGPYLDSCNDAPDMVWIGGDLRADAVFTAGHLEVGGHLIAREAVVGDYNDGAALIHGGLETRLFVPTDHHFEVRGGVEAERLVGHKGFLEGHANRPFDEGEALLAEFAGAPCRVAYRALLAGQRVFQ